MEAMRRFEHGGDVYTHADAIDFSANLNPLGMPQAVRDAIVASVDSFDAYPDPHCRELKAAISLREGVDESLVVVTAGATDLMTRVCFAMRPNRALVTAPCYSGYEQALEQAGAAIDRHILREEDGFALTESLLDSMSPEHELLFIASPNNPTGLTIPRPLLVIILERAAELGARVVLDECFIEFTDQDSAVKLAGEYPGLIVMKAFTKSYAIAGLRLGYGICSDAAFVEQLHAVGQMWAVSTPAQKAGIAACSLDGFIEQTRAYVKRQRENLQAGLEELDLRVVAGEANYLMFFCEQELYEPLLEHGILVRRCENYHGLGLGWYRVAVRTEEENACLLEALGAVLQPAG